MKYPDPESSSLELKREIPENDQILKTIIGFCNRNGGKLVLGVDSNRNIVGISEEKVQELMEYLRKNIFEASSPPILPAIYSQRIGEKTLLVIGVSSGMNKPYYRKSEGLDKGAYVRLGRSTLRANSDMIEELRWESRGRSYDMMPVYHGKEEDLDKKKLERFIGSKKGAKFPSFLPDILPPYHLVHEEHSAIYPTVGGVLLFGQNPQFFFPEAIVLCTHFSGVGGREAIASIDCVGTLFDQFSKAYEFIVSRLNRSFSINGPKRSEKLELPEVAIRETLINALVHRNYRIPAPIKIAIYENRIEIFSPGVFAGPLDTRNLKLGITYIRNPVICKVFWEAGYVEKLGSGFITLFDSYEKWRLPSPEVVEGENFIKCILPRGTSQKAASSANRELDRILALFEVADEITISDIIQILHISRPTAGRRIAKLMESGEVVQEGKGRGVRYRKTK
ncbi:MAG: hypothetical protein K940chlam9_00400 [Chlamydiae bacterium]|nr:hypothetical protein [Chlamydiota bacterium]